MAQVFIAPTAIIIDGLFGPRQHDSHCQGWRWHLYISNVNKDYLAEVARRQADKRAAGIGPEGRCPR
jgi:hypothetical protein